jgi:hypothetical protein
MKRVFMAVGLTIALTGCSRSCEKASRNFESGNRVYEITVYSGGDVVFQDEFTGIINDAEGSNGCYYFKGDSLIEINGDYILKSVEE